MPVGERPNVSCTAETDRTMNRFGVRKPDFSFGRMHIHINPPGVYVQKEHEYRIVPLRQKGTIAVGKRVEHRGILDRSPIDEQILRSLGCPSPHWIDDKSLDTEAFFLRLDFQCPIHKCFPVNLQHSIALP